MTFSSILASSNTSALAARRKYQTAGAMTSSRTQRLRMTTTTRISTRRTIPFVQSSYQTLEQTLSKIKDLPPSERPEALRMAEQPVKSLLNEMKENNTISKWNSLGKIQSENVFPRAFTEVGLTDVDAKIGTPNNGADFNFIVTVTVTTSLLAVIIGVTLPGDWGAFGSYLMGGVSLVVLAVGSTAPGLLKVGVDTVSRLNPEYMERIVKHEAAHFLIAYLSGIPVSSYSLGLMEMHVELLEAKIEKKLVGKAGVITTEEMEALAVVAMSGVAAEAKYFEKVAGQEADLFSLQKAMNKTEPKLGAQKEQSVTRWAVYKAARIITDNEKSYERLCQALKEGKSVAECVKAIESV